MMTGKSIAVIRKRRTPQGVRGLKFDNPDALPEVNHSRTPQGVRGLKCDVRPVYTGAKGVAPRKGCVD